MNQSIQQKLEELIKELESKGKVRIQIIVEKTTDTDEAIEAKMLEEETKKNKATSNDNSIEERVRQLITELGVPKHIKGYGYLIDAINAIINNPEKINKVNKVLYPEIARLNQTTSSSIERLIRYAIEKSWLTSVADERLKYQIFGKSVNIEKHRPTATHYMAAIAYYVKYTE